MDAFIRLDRMLRAIPIVHALVASIFFAVLVYGTLGLIFYAIERGQRRDTDRYKTRHFWNDAAYTFLYQGGIYNILIYAPVFALLAPRLSFLQINALKHVPPVVSIIIYWTAADFAAYWIHRVQHRVPWLWAFHSVHHTQTRMTYLTSNRNHVLEQVYVNLVMLAPALLLGMPPSRWMPLYFAQTFFEHAQHAQLRWTYGPLHRILVSPAFHAMHHSTAEADYNGNYAKIFSTWDILFGTYVRSDSEPRSYGVEGMDVDETLAAQFLHPFRLLRRGTLTPGPGVRTISASH